MDLTVPTSAVPMAAAPGNVTRCGLCHSTSEWDDVRFDHDKTGFPLKGSHRRVMCKACHPINFKDRIPDTCVGCHRDPHAAEFGQQCEGCHDEEHWPTSFNADAHRRTNFPLSGRHAFIPCAECHPNARTRGFSRSPVTCATCHMPDFTRTGMTTIDHTVAGFSTECRQCHSTIRWSPARFPQHDHCFPISAGPHAGIRCTTCHTSLPPTTMSGSCNTKTAACTSCHEHSCDRSNPIHANLGSQYKCVDLLCYQCHQVGK